MEVGFLPLIIIKKKNERDRKREEEKGLWSLAGEDYFAIRRRVHLPINAKGELNKRKAILEDGRDDFE